MHFFNAVTLFIIACMPISYSLSLLNALKQNANASIFAQIIENDPSIAAVYLSSYTRTVFAPSDDALNAANIHPNSFLKSRQTNYAGEAADSDVQVTHRLSSTYSLRQPRSAVIETFDNNGNLGGSNISLPTDAQSEYGAKKMKRGLSGCDNNTMEPVKIFSGLGNTVSIIKEDIPYDHGLIQTTDGQVSSILENNNHLTYAYKRRFFTLPKTLSETAKQKGHTNFADLVCKTNLTNTLDATPAITVFIPTNKALQSFLGNTTQGSNDLTTLLSNHVITGFVGYLPLLQNRASYATTARTNLTVTIKNGIYSINGARIVASNLITQNGVAHVIDKVSTTPPVKKRYKKNPSQKGESTLVPNPLIYPPKTGPRPSHPCHSFPRCFFLNRLLNQPHDCFPDHLQRSPACGCCWTYHVTGGRKTRRLWLLVAGTDDID